MNTFLVLKHNHSGYQPWRNLYLGFFLLITKRRPLRRTILQSGVRFFNDALVFIIRNYLYLNTILPLVRS